MDRGRNTYIDLMRAAAICPVLLLHWVNSHLTRVGSSIVDRAYSSLASHGANGVLLFFVISGFVITRAAMAREPDLFGLSFRTFYARRFARIYPLLIAVCIIGIGLLTFSGSPTPLREFIVRNRAAVFDATFWVSIVTFTFNFWRTANLHIASGWGLHWDVMWSLAVEEQFYAAFPLLLSLSKNRSRLFLVLLAIILLSAGYRLSYGWNQPLYDSLVCFELIAVGVLSAVFAPKIPRLARIPLAMFGSIMLSAGFLMPKRMLLSLFVNEFTAIGAGVLLCCAISAEKNRSIPLILPIAFIGELSYGMYLLHPMVLYAVGETISVFGHIIGYFSFVAATTAIAALSYRYYEKPSERFVRRSLTEAPL